MEEQEKIILPSVAVGDYNKDWKQTFDLQFLIGWFVLFVVMLVVTAIFDKSLFS